jgi:hypothetical protein
LESDSKPAADGNQTSDAKPLDAAVRRVEHGEPKANGRQSRTQREGKHPLEYAIFVFLVLTAIFTGIAACYTRKQWITADDTEKRSLRAYVSVANGHVELEEKGRKITAFVEIKNFGQTPAHEFKAWIKPPKILDSAALPFDAAIPIKERETSGILGPQTSYNAIYTMDITDTELAELMAGNKKVFFWGGADYKDAFQNDRFLYFRMVSSTEGSGPGWFFSAPKLGSDAD